MIKTALISVYNKKWIAEFAKILQNKWINIISTWWTFRYLKENWINAMEVSDITWFPELMNWRVKTLHPRIHWWLLALRNKKEHLEEIKQNNINLIDLVVVNLYPFQETINTEWINEEDAIEQIDIWWPSMLRSAAKNFENVTIITEIADLNIVWKQIQEKWETDLETRRNLAVKAFYNSSKYDAQIARYLSKWEKIALFFEKKQNLRYGENPHQKAMFLKWESKWINITNAKQIQWKELSYNNILDWDLAWQIVEEFESPCVAIVKHATPCWVALSYDILKAYEKAYDVDKISPFWWIIAANRAIWKDLAEKLVEFFLEIIIATNFTKEALEIFKKKEKLRILEMWWIKKEYWDKVFKKVWWWLLIQDKNEWWELKNLVVVTEKKPNKDNIDDMQFWWKVIKYVKSNAIIIVKDKKTIWIGAWQTNRIKSVRLALNQARENCQNLDWAVLISDAFFPFIDCIEELENTWITCVLQPGWSINDNKVIDKANEIWISMIFCWERAFLH